MGPRSSSNSPARSKKRRNVTLSLPIKMKIQELKISSLRDPNVFGGLGSERWKKSVVSHIGFPVIKVKDVERWVKTHSWILDSNVREIPGIAAKNRTASTSSRSTSSSSTVQAPSHPGNSAPRPDLYAPGIEVDFNRNEDEGVPVQMEPAVQEFVPNKNSAKTANADPDFKIEEIQLDTSDDEEIQVLDEADYLAALAKQYGDQNGAPAAVAGPSSSSSSSGNTSDSGVAVGGNAGQNQEIIAGEITITSSTQGPAETVNANGDGDSPMDMDNAASTNPPAMPEVQKVNTANLNNKQNEAKPGPLSKSKWFWSTGKYATSSNSAASASTADQTLPRENATTRPQAEQGTSSGSAPGNGHENDEYMPMPTLTAEQYYQHLMLMNRAKMIFGQLEQEQREYEYQYPRGLGYRNEHNAGPSRLSSFQPAYDAFGFGNALRQYQSGFTGQAPLAPAATYRTSDHDLKISEQIVDLFSTIKTTLFQLPDHESLVEPLNGLIKAFDEFSARRRQGQPQPK